MLGIDYWVSDVWAARHAEHVLSIWDVVSLWMEKVPREARRLAKFARWLSKPPAAKIRLRTLPWFRNVLADEKRSVYRDEDVEDDRKAPKRRLGTGPDCAARDERRVRGFSVFTRVAR